MEKRNSNAVEMVIITFLLSFCISLFTYAQPSSLNHSFTGRTRSTYGPISWQKNDMMLHRSDSFSLPGKQYLYSWQENQQWELEIFSTFTYQENTMVDTNVNYYQENGNPFNRVIHEYDISGHLIGIAIQKFDTSWYNNIRFEYDYDEHDNLILDLYYIWFSNDWQKATGRRNNYTYDHEGKITDILNESYNALQGWLYHDRVSYVFNETDEPAEIITYYWVSSEWINNTRLHTITWKNYDGEHASGEYLSYIQDKDVGGEWQHELRRSYTYYQNGTYEYIEQSYRGGDNWMNEAQFESIRDMEGNLVEEKTSGWVEDQWQQTGGSRYFYSFDGIDLAEIIIQAWDTSQFNYINSERLVFSDFVHFQSVRESTEGIMNLKIYPNPVKDLFFVDMDRVRADEMILLDVHGRIVLRRFLEQEDKHLRISVPDISRGIYFIMMMNEGRIVMGGRMVKI